MCLFNFHGALVQYPIRWRQSFTQQCANIIWHIPCLDITTGVCWSYSVYRSKCNSHSSKVFMTEAGGDLSVRQPPARFFFLRCNNTIITTWPKSSSSHRSPSLLRSPIPSILISSPLLPHLPLPPYSLCLYSLYPALFSSSLLTSMLAGVHVAPLEEAYAESRRICNCCRCKMSLNPGMGSQ